MCKAEYPGGGTFTFSVVDRKSCLHTPLSKFQKTRAYFLGSIFLIIPFPWPINFISLRNVLWVKSIYRFPSVLLCLALLSLQKRLNPSLFIDRWVLFLRYLVYGLPYTTYTAAI